MASHRFACCINALGSLLTFSTAADEAKAKNRVIARQNLEYEERGGVFSEDEEDEDKATFL